MTKPPVDDLHALLVLALIDRFHSYWKNAKVMKRAYRGLEGRVRPDARGVVRRFTKSNNPHALTTKVLAALVIEPPKEPINRGLENIKAKPAGQPGPEQGASRPAPAGGSDPVVAKRRSPGRDPRTGRFVRAQPDARPASD